MSERSKKVLILGGGVGGVAVATRLRRLDEQVELTIVERGETEIPNLDRVQWLTGCDAIRIDRSARHMVVRDQRSLKVASLPFDKLVLAPGTVPIRPHIPGMELPLVHAVRTLAEIDRILDRLDGSPNSTAPVAILGGGWFGLKIAEILRRREISVTIFEAARQVFIEADLEMVAPIHDELRRQGIDLRLGISISNLVQDADRIRLATLDGEEISSRLLIVAVGVQPEVSLALDAGISVGLTGAIKVNDRMQTNDPDIYAIGGVAQQETHLSKKTLVSRPNQAGSAIRQARIVADHIHGFHHHAFESFGGAMAVNVFGLALAIAGFNEKRLKRERIPYEKVYLTVTERTEPVPDETLALKVLFSPTDGKILGAQAVGRSDVERRIDILSTAIRFDGTVRQLAGIELCGAPPMGRNDPVLLAGNAASNVLDGLVRHATIKEMKRPGADQLVLDVRSPSEFQGGAIPGAVSLPFEHLRKRLDELDRDKEYLVYSRFGKRAYLACRILSQAGFTVKNFPGGLTVFRRLVGERRSSIDG